MNFQQVDHLYSPESLPGESICVLDFKGAANSRFSHHDVVFDLFIETRFLHFITFLSNFWIF